MIVATAGVATFAVFRRGQEHFGISSTGVLEEASEPSSVLVSLGFPFSFGRERFPDSTMCDAGLRESRVHRDADGVSERCLRGLRFAVVRWRRRLEGQRCRWGLSRSPSWLTSSHKAEERAVFRVGPWGSTARGMLARRNRVSWVIRARAEQS